MTKAKAAPAEVYKPEPGQEDLLAVPGDMKRTTEGSSEQTRAEHSPIGASSADRWFRCPGSVRLSAGIEETGPPEDWRAQGVVAHVVAAACLKEVTDAWEYLGHKIDVPSQGIVQFEVDQEMVDGVQLYLDTIRDDIGDDPEGKIIYIERTFTLESVDPDAYGTVDCGVLYVTKDLLRVYDLKYGVGVIVEVIENPQEMYYGAGIVSHIAETNPQDVPGELELVIVQPRAEHPKGPVRRWRISTDKLGTWTEEVLAPRAKETRDPNAPLRPGEWCRFCKAKGICPALRGMFDEFTGGVKPVELEAWEIAERLTRVAAVRKYIGWLEDEAFTRLIKGETVPGFKIVKKKSNRVWKDEAADKIVAKFGEEAWNHTIKSPAQVEKLSDGKPFVKLLAFKPDTGLTWAPEDDKRDPVSARTVREVFKDLLAH